MGCCADNCIWAGEKKDFVTLFLHVPVKKTQQQNQTNPKQPLLVRAHGKPWIYKASAVLCLILLHIRAIFHIQIWLAAISSQYSSCPVWLTDCSQIHCFTKGVSRTLVSVLEENRTTSDNLNTKIPTHFVSSSLKELKAVMATEDEAQIFQYGGSELCYS